MSGTLSSHLAAILLTKSPEEKARNARLFFREHRKAPPLLPPQNWPDPATRDVPPLKPPSEMPKRGLGSLAGRQALLHAVAHIELNAIDLAADMAGRFGHELAGPDQERFLQDWLVVMDDEARHFLMVADRLTEMGSGYGCLPAHDGLFEAARRTSHDILARLAIAPMVLEARGLDVTPGMIEKFRRQEDHASADVLEVIYCDEIGHVATGIKWFRYICTRQEVDPRSHFQALVTRYFPGGLKKPFNDGARSEAGFERQWYEGLA